MKIITGSSKMVSTSGADAGCNCTPIIGAEGSKEKQMRDRSIILIIQGVVLVSTPLRSSGKDTVCRKGLRVSIVQVASGHIAVLDALNTAAAQP